MKILDESSLSNEEKVELWHAGKRRENIKACGEEKLADFWRIARDRGYFEILDAIDDECTRRGISPFGVKVAIPIGEVSNAEDITDRIFKVLVSSIEYVFENDIEDELTDEYDDVYWDGDWPNPSYANVKQQKWAIDWSGYYTALSRSWPLDEQIADIESKIIQNYQDKIFPVVVMAKDEIVKKYKSKDHSLVPLVEKILDTVDITIGNHPIFDPAEGNFDGEVLLQLEAQLPD